MAQGLWCEGVCGSVEVFHQRTHYLCAGHAASDPVCLLRRRVFLFISPLFLRSLVLPKSISCRHASHARDCPLSAVGEHVRSPRRVVSSNFGAVRSGTHLVSQRKLFALGPSHTFSRNSSCCMRKTRDRSSLVAGAGIRGQGRNGYGAQSSSRLHPLISVF
jgi:hypothetical protein